MSEDKKDTVVDDDKSINDLLKEYAQEGKDSELDDFLKDTDEDVFADETDPEEEGDRVLAESGGAKKTSSLLVMALIVVAFGAAGVGAYKFLNQDEGMTMVRGDFDATADNDMSVPAALPDTIETQSDVPNQPMPIMNAVDDASATAPAEDVLIEDVTSASSTPDIMIDEEPKADIVATLAPVSEPAPETQSAPTSNVDTAVDAWLSGTSEEAAADVMPALITDAKPVAAPASLPEKQVDVVKATPPVAADTSSKDVKEPVAPAPVVATTKKQTPAAPRSSADDALLPPFMTMNNPNAPKFATPVTTDVTTTKDSVQGVTNAPADIAEMVANGGGMIELPGRTQVLTMPSNTVAPAAPVVEIVAPEVGEEMPAVTPEASLSLAINGAKSRPISSGEPAKRELVQQAAPAAEAPADEEVPQQAVTQPEEAVEAPVVEAPAPTSANQASMNNARALVTQAMMAEKAGRADEALILFQRALEIDAIEGDGQSIDRGMVYDHIGALRTGL